MSKTYTYYAIGYDYKKPSEWFAGSEEEALAAFLAESKDKTKLRVQVVAETYMVDSASKIQHVCEQGCRYHLLLRSKWTHFCWGPPRLLRRLVSRSY